MLSAPCLAVHGSCRHVNKFQQLLRLRTFDCITYCCSAGSGGAVYVDGSTAASVTLTNITNTILKNNKAAQANHRGDGGAIYLAGGISTINNTTFLENQANRYGGAIAYRHHCFDFANVPIGLPGAILQQSCKTCSMRIIVITNIMIVIMIITITIIIVIIIIII